MMPELSVIMSVYNDEKYLKQAIESILNQSFSDFELLITNDASEDSSLEIIRQYEKRDKRIIFINNSKNIGLPASLNHMIGLAKGCFIARMDGDDISFKERFEKELSVIKKKNADFIFTQTKLIDEDGNVMCKSWKPKTVKRILQLLPFRNYISHPTVLIRAELLKSNLYNESYRRAQDAELWNRLLTKNIRWEYIKEPLLFYRCKKKINDKHSADYIMANLAISNNCKHIVWRYFPNMNRKEKILILFKQMIPFRILLCKGLLQCYFMRNCHAKKN